MYIPIINDCKYSIGNDVVLVEQLELSDGIFTIGHKFKIKSGSDNTFTLIDKDKNIAEGINFTKFRHDVIVNQIREKRIFNENKRILDNELSSCCPNLDYSFADREKYITCKLKPSDSFGYDDACSPDFKCVQYLPQKSLNKKKIKSFLRKLKIDKLL